ncbi:MAG: hypothetical protein AB8W37_01420 [Arsenophonus endosymbiont of Dermacentor nuttalli]
MSILFLSLFTFYYFLSVPYLTLVLLFFLLFILVTDYHIHRITLKDLDKFSPQQHYATLVALAIEGF